MNFKITPGGSLRGHLRVPGDKSISHRALLLGALADGKSEIHGLLEGEDTLATLAACRAMGVAIEGPENGVTQVHGVGLRGLRQPRADLDLGNSGTGMRLLAGVLAGQTFQSRVTGDASLRRRPMRRITEPLASMGAVVSTSDSGTAPLTIGPADGALTPIDFDMPVASAQLKSCLLLAGLYADGCTWIREPQATRDHTERMLSGAFAYPVHHREGRIGIDGGGRLAGARLTVPGDISSAAFLMVGAAVAAGSDLTIQHVGVNPTRTGVVDVLKMMGADLTLNNERDEGGEPVADIRVRGSRLRGVRIPESLVARAIDEFPALFIAAACANGETVVSGASELRVKESDRIAAMADGLQRLGADARPTPDGIVIRGGDLRGGRVASYEDHRVAMAFAMSGLRAGAPLVIEDCDNVDTSFPAFAKLTASAGLGIRTESSS